MFIIPAAHGPSVEKVDLLGASISDNTISPTQAEVGYQLSPTGAEQTFEGTGQPYGTINTWLNVGSASDYECRLTVNSGTAPDGSGNGVWLGMGTARAWGWIDSVIPGDVQANCTIEIRDAVTLNVLASATITVLVDMSV